MACVASACTKWVLEGLQPGAGPELYMRHCMAYDKVLRVWQDCLAAICYHVTRLVGWGH